MTVSLYCENISRISDENFSKFLSLIPSSIHPEILRFRDRKNQKARLLSRLMLIDALKKNDSNISITHLRLDARNKPVIPEWHHFSISYSENMVLLAHSENSIGLDIEKREPINFEELSSFFSKSEQAYILNSSNPNESFYTTWVKKEALLKAVGTGIVEGLSDENTLTPIVNYLGKQWHYTPLKHLPNFEVFLCSNEPIISINMVNFNPETLFEY